MIGLGLGFKNNSADRLANFKSQLAAIENVVVPDESYSVYNNLSPILKRDGVLFGPLAYKGNTVYAMDGLGNPVAMTHGRGSNATFMDKDGSIKFAAHNLFAYSADITQWTPGASGVATAPVITNNIIQAPDGSMTAARAIFSLNGGTTVSDYSRMLRTANILTPNVAYRNSVWLKSNTGFNYSVYMVSPANILTVITITPTWQEFSLDSIGGISNTSTLTFQLYIVGNGATSSSADIAIWRPRTRAIQSPDVYVPTVNTPVYCPRFEFTNGLPALLMERAATNLVLNCDPTAPEGAAPNVTYGSFAWPMGILKNAIFFPDGSTASTRGHYAGTVASSTTYIISAYVKMNDGGVPIPGSAAGTDFNFRVGGVDAAQASYIIRSLGSGVYHVQASVTTLPPGQGTLTFNGVTKAPTASQRGFALSGLQIETGSAYATTLIFTTGATATRAADTFASIGDVIPYSDASFYINAAAIKDSSNAILYVVRGNTNGRLWYEGNSDFSRVSYFAFDGTNAVSAINVLGNAGVFNKCMTVYGTAGLKVTRDSSAVSSSSFVGTMGVPGPLSFGSVNLFILSIRSFAIIPRQLSDTEMQQVTT